VIYMCPSFVASMFTFEPIAVLRLKVALLHQKLFGFLYARAPFKKARAYISFVIKRYL